MEVIIVCHTELGYVKNKNIIFDKGYSDGVTVGVNNLISIADAYNAKITFAVCPEVIPLFPNNIFHEIGLHVHPGWIRRSYKEYEWYVGDTILYKECKQSVSSPVLRDHPYEEQYEMIRIGKKMLSEYFYIEPKVFVAGKWSLNNDTIKALIENGFTHDCSAPAGSKLEHYDWSRLPRICPPYCPSAEDYQQKGNLPLIIVPISQMFKAIGVSPENEPIYGLKWLKACFMEYYREQVPVFHICLHSPSMTDGHFLEVMKELIKFISKHNDIKFSFASEIQEYCGVRNFKTNVLPYFQNINGKIIILAFKSIRYLFRNKR